MTVRTLPRDPPGEGEPKTKLKIVLSTAKTNGSKVDASANLHDETGKDTPNQRDAKNPSKTLSKPIKTLSKTF